MHPSCGPMRTQAATPCTQVTVSETTDDDLHELLFPRGLHLMYYVLWAGNEGYHYKRGSFQTVLDRLAETCVPNDYTVIPDRAGGGGGSSGGTVVLVLVCLLAGFGAAYLFVGERRGWPVASKVSGVFASVFSRIKEMATSSTRANTAPSPLTAQHGLAGQDSAAPYQAPLPSPSPIGSPA